ncbi:hypothetical protein B1F79_03930 [Coxiella-like endosymbiont of Rhipicephalus sanguineus]|uniref:hypothetical protein n=1 Tax=Coxiella-like endosymbiont of Rhipicephalus sanguineus TaxID=1955402 RepID=UPI002042514B|nr:hypothetical protein [Coxiella-like endosymbiont of Rhipicephalus sanguineus]MBT8506649.1 hypothetical protein [Coxiella-like endosymbiont of Rhipicephalus sanguineus]
MGENPEWEKLVLLLKNCHPETIKRPIAIFMGWLLRVVNPSDQESREWLRKIFQLDFDDLLYEEDRRRNKDLTVNSLLYTVSKRYDCARQR